MQQNILTALYTSVYNITDTIWVYRLSYSVLYYFPSDF